LLRWGVGLGAIVAPYVVQRSWQDAVGHIAGGQLDESWRDEAELHLASQAALWGSRRALLLPHSIPVFFPGAQGGVSQLQNLKIPALARFFKKMIRMSRTNRLRTAVIIGGPVPQVSLNKHIVPRFPSKSGLMNKHIVKQFFVTLDARLSPDYNTQAYRETYRDIIA
jgi:hypothetical protein